LNKETCHLQFEVVVPVVILELTTEDFNKRDFPSLFKKTEPVIDRLSDDLLFDQYLKEHQWKSFKKNLTTQVLGEKVAKNSLFPNSIIKNSYSRSFKDSAIKILDDSKDSFIMKKSYVMTAKFMSDQTKLPLILTLKAKASIYETIDKRKLRGRIFLKPLPNENLERT
jgi:hypothetical protein